MGVLSPKVMVFFDFSFFLTNILFLSFLLSFWISVHSIQYRPYLSMHSFIFLYISYCREYFYFKTVKNNYFYLLSLPPPLPPFWIFSFYFIKIGFFLSFFL